MTISNQTDRTSAVGSGAVGQEIPFSFPIKDTSDLTCIQRVTATGVPTDLVETTNYTVSISGDTGGTITTVTAIATTAEFHAIRKTPRTQSLDLETGGSFNAENIEDALDKNTRLITENKETIGRLPAFPDTDPASSIGDYPNSVDRASLGAGFDSAGKPTAISAVPAGSVAFTAFGTNLAETASAATARGLLELDTTDDVEFAEVTAADVITKAPWTDVRNYASINAAVTAIGATETTLVVPDAQTLTAAVAIPTTMALKVLKGGSIDGAYTITINGLFEASDWPFGATTTVVFTASSSMSHYITQLNIRAAAPTESDITTPQYDEQGIAFFGTNDNKERFMPACIIARATNDRDGYEQGELWFGVLDNINSSGDYVTPIKIDKVGIVTMGPALTPFGYNRQPASDYTNISAPSDEVTGTDTLNYVCIMRHTGDATNRPITGANWKSFWEQKGSAGVAWVDTTAYTPNRIFGERLGVFEGDSGDAKPFAVRNLKTSNDDTFTVGIGYSLLNDSDIERFAGIARFGFYDATALAELAEWHLALMNKSEEIKGPYYRAESADSTSTYYSNMGPYGTRDYVVDKTANYTILYTDTKKLFTNQGAKGIITFTLPEMRFVGTGFAARFKQGALYLNGTESAFKWTDSPATPGEYYAELVAGGDPSLAEPEAIYVAAALQTKGTLGSLANGEWEYGDQDTLGYNTIYFKHASGDPDGFNVGSITVTYRFRVARGNANEVFFVPGVPGSGNAASIESDGRLGTGVDLISFGNVVIAQAGYIRSWTGMIAGYWKITGATDGFLTFTAADATPSVLNGKTFFTSTTGVTITRLDDGYGGQEITLISKGATVYDTTANDRLLGSSVDITTASGDVTMWICETGGTTASVWRLKGFVDISADNSGGA